jgi:predicted permease
MFRQLRDDVRHAGRAMLGMPLLASVVIISLAVGIGVNAIVFSWLQALVWHPLPGVGAASDVFLIEPRTETGGRPGAAWPEYEDLRQRLEGITELVAFRMAPITVGIAPRNERAYGLLVSDNYFDVLGLGPAAGRFPSRAELSRGADGDVAVVSYDFWQARLGGAGSAVGESLHVNGRALTIVGVTPEGFQGTVLGLQFDVWVPAASAPLLVAGSAELDSRASRGYYLLARIGSGARRAQAAATVDQTMRELAARYPESNTALTADVLPFWRASRGPQGLLLQGVAVLQGMMLLLLLAVCANTANLMLARATARQREMGVRLAVGAGPWRVVRLLLVENLLLALVAAVLGTVLAFWGTGAMRAVPVMSTAFPVRFQTDVNLVTLLFTLMLASGSAALCALAPAWHLARLDPLRAIQGTGGFANRSRFGRALMAGEVALAVVVLLVAGLFYRSFSETRELDPGFRREGVLLAAYDLGGQARDNDAGRLFADRLLAATRALPEVQAAAIAASVPLDIHGLPQRSFVLEGHARVDGGRDRALTNIVTPGYFETMGIPLIDGTDFSPLGDASAAPQVVVNEAFVRRYVPEGAVLGRRLESGGRTYTVVGVARTSVYDAFGEPDSPAIHFSYRDRPALQGELHMRTRPGAEGGLAMSARRVVREIDASLPLYNVRTLGDHVETNLFLRRIPARLFVVLGPLLLVLAAIGIYAVVAYAVAQRTTEIGVRLALGATARRVTGQIVGESLRTIGGGALAGWVTVYAVYIHLAQGAPVTLSVFAGIPLALLAVAAVSAWLPARRVSRVDPLVALRRE